MVVHCRTIRGRGKIDLFCSRNEWLPAVLANVLQDGDLVLAQGAGDIGKVAKRLVQIRYQNDDDIENMKKS